MLGSFFLAKAIVAMLGFSMLGGDWRLARYDEIRRQLDEIWTRFGPA
jgi:hypothetical protein